MGLLHGLYSTCLPETMCEALRDTGMWNVYTQIELPLIFTLDSMEKWGISVKSEELKSYGEKLSVRIGELEKQIWQQAGEEFNINLRNRWE